MNDLKRIAAGISVLLLAAMTAACGNTNTSQTTPANQTAPATTEAVATADETTAQTTEPETVAETEKASEYTELLDWYYHQISTGWSDYDRDTGGYGVAVEEDAEDAVSYLWYHFEKPGISEAGYQLIDINHDGTDELIVGVKLNAADTDADSDILYDLYTIYDGKPVRLASGGERDYFSVGDGVICEGGSGGAALHVNITYHLEDGKLVPIEEYKYDGMEDEENPYFYSNETIPAEWGGYEFQNWQHITEEELQQCGNYEMYDLHLQLFSEYTPSQSS